MSGNLTAETLTLTGTDVYSLIVQPSDKDYSALLLDHTGNLAVNGNFTAAQGGATFGSTITSGPLSYSDQEGFQYTAPGGTSISAYNTGGGTAVLGFSRTAPGGASSEGCAGLESYAINDKTSGDATAYGLYIQARRYPETGFTEAAELVSINLGDVQTLTPYVLPDGATMSALLGAGLNTLNCNPSSVAAYVSGSKDYAQFQTGIVFGSTALVSGGHEGYNYPFAIDMAQSHSLVWREGATWTPVAAIRSDISTASGGGEIVFTDQYINVVSQNGGSQLQVGNNGVFAPYLLLGGSVVATGHVGINQSGLFLEWNRDNGGASSYLINAKPATNENGGFRFCESDLDDNLTQTAYLDKAGNLSVIGGLAFEGYLSGVGTAGAAVPTVSSGTLVGGSSDTRGAVTLPSGITTTTVTFATAFTSAPFISVTPSQVVAIAGSSTTTTITITVASNASGVTVNWMCLQ